jgi:hypothetical protein
MDKLLSHTNNCLIFNALRNNGAPMNVSDIKFFQKFRADMLPEVQQEYYDRSNNLVNLIKTTKGDTSEVWNSYYTTYVQSIISDLRSRKPNDAAVKMRQMVEAIEKELMGE